MSKASDRRAGLTLLELTIVVVVVSLLVGAVLGGKSLIRAAEMRGVMTDTNLYITAVNNFRQQFRYLPGDFNRASSYWSGTNDGNGDGQVKDDERFIVWQHLNLAGFIEGVYSGMTGAGGPDDFVIIETASTTPNTPMGRLKDSGYAFYYAENSGGSTRTYDTPNANALTYAKMAGANSGVPDLILINPVDAYMLDTKLDDGKPGAGNWVANMTGGNVFSSTASNPTCTTSANSTAYSGDYKMSIKTVQCSFFIYGGW